MRRARWIAGCALSAVIAVMATTGRAQQASGADLAATLRRIEAARAGVNTIEADFDQDRVMGLFAQTLHAQGRLVVQRPNKVRWEIRSPDPGVFVVDGDRVAYRAGGSGATANQNQVGPLGAVLHDLAAFLGGSLQSLQARYTMTVASTDGGGLLLIASPTDPQVARVVSSVRLQFAPNLQSIDAIEMNEPSGDRTAIRVHGARINSGNVRASAFTATP